MRTALALLATIVCGVLAAANFVFFAILLITKALILFADPRAILAIVVFGANAFALGWLALQAARQVGRPRVSAQH